MATKVYDAIHEIHLMQTPGKPGDRSKGIAPTPPVVKVIKANTRLSLDDKDERIEYLMDAGAIRVADMKNERGVEKVDPVGKKATAAKAPAKKAPAAKTNDEGSASEDLV